ncbi:MAG: chemotaxis protein CheY [Proteobacteria bacterium]|jgi:twitching motility two-component system response regulator PilH|nr:chemotaxis protein CheY [Pseudomonadota bacterium]MCU0807281.1 response regulator [Candidatus Contendobacter sp.]
MAVRKILVVDDSPTDLVNIKNIVTEAGYIVVTATDGKDAVEKAKVEKPDLIFMDIIMPDMDGYAACRLLSNESATKDIPVVFVTSKKQKADKLWAQMQGGKAFITKPYTADAIIDQLKAFL